MHSYYLDIKKEHDNLRNGTSLKNVLLCLLSKINTENMDSLDILMHSYDWDIIMITKK